MLQFTERGRAVVEAAQANARVTGSPSVGIAHLGLALLDLAHGVAHMALQILGVRTETIRERIADATGVDPAAASPWVAQPAQVPFAPSTQRLLEEAASEAEAMGHQYLGTEHLLIALTASDDPAGNAFRAAGVTPEAVRQAVREVLGNP